MPTKIPEFFFDEAAREVSAFSESFLKKHKLNYFQYCTVYKDGSHSFLVNRPDFVRKRWEEDRGVRSHVDSDCVGDRNFVFLWNENLPEADTSMAREFDIDKGICFVERKSTHYNLIAFAASQKEQGTLNFYLNHMSKLRSFIEEFKENAKDLIGKAEKQRFGLNENVRDKNESVLLWHPSSSDLSDREFECLRMIAQGFSMADIGDQLKISSRTVETYLQRVKIKLKINKKADLIRHFYKIRS